MMSEFEFEFSEDDTGCRIPSEITDDFLSELRNGGNPDIESYARRIPELFDQVTEYLETLLFAENLQQGRYPGDEKTPQTIGAYRIDHVLGRGGMGTVYQATHPRINRTVAIKVLHPGKAYSKSNQERFLREAETSARLNHPNIVTVHDFGEDDGRSFIVMQAVKGVALNTVLSEARDRSFAAQKKYGWVAKDFRRIAQLGADVASALEHAHRLGTIHRDIKPANLLVDEDDRIWVTDFGLAKLRDDDSDLSSTGEMIGTPRYMSPEQVRGIADERSDIYGLGITLYEVASGHCAWNTTGGATPGGLLKSKSHMELADVREVNDAVPNRLADIIMRACALRSEDRYQTAAELQQALMGFLTGEPICHHRLQMNGVSIPPALRQFLFAIVAGTVLLSGLGLANREYQSVLSNPVSSVEALDVLPAGGLVSVQENTTAIGYVSPPHAEDSIVWRLAGPDSDFFHIDQNSGWLSCRHPIDYEMHCDSDADNLYQLTTIGEFSDRKKPNISRDFTVELKDVNEPPQFRASFGTQTLPSTGPRYRGRVRADDPEGFGLSWQSDPAGDQRLMIDPFGRLYDRSPVSNRLTRGDSFRISADDSCAQRTLLFFEDGEPYARFLDHNGELSDDTMAVSLPPRLRGVATADGKSFFCLHIETTDSVQTMALSVSDLTSWSVLSEDCGLPPTATGLATEDGVFFHTCDRGALQRVRLKKNAFTDGKTIRRVSPAYNAVSSLEFSRVQLAELKGSALYVDEYIQDYGFAENLPLPINGVNGTDSIAGLCRWLEKNPASVSEVSAVRLRIR